MMEADSSQKRNCFIPAILFLVAVCLRLPFTSKLLYHHDSVNFALALEQYDLRLHQPHPPGYFLYVMLGRAVHLAIPDPNLALITISMVATSLAVVFVYLLAKEMYDFRTSVIASLLAVVSPNLWFHGEVALSYGVEALFSAAMGYLCWNLYQGRGQLLFASAVTLAVAGGFRQNTLAFLLPLWLLSLTRVELRKALAALLLLVGVSGMWFWGMIRMTGGMDAYFASLGHLWESNTGHSSAFEMGWRSLGVFCKTLLAFNFYSIGAGTVLLATAGYLVWRSGGLGSTCRGKRGFYLAWMLPPYLFYQFVFIQPSNPGYVLILLPPLLLLSARGLIRTADFMREVSGVACLHVLTAAVLVANASLFLCSDYPVSWRSLKEHDRDLAVILKRVARYDANTTAVVLKPYVFYGFRMIMYYLPQYRVYNFPSAGDSADGGVFWGVGRRTFLTRRMLFPEQLQMALTFDYEHRDSAGWDPIGVEGVSMAYGPAAIILRQMGPPPT
jgi:hypothetical protein